MTPRSTLLGAAVVLCTLSAAVGAVELPVRKAGLWEMKMVRTGSPIPDMTMQHCTDETTDKEMSTAASPMAKDACSKQDIQKTTTGYVSDSVCSVAGTTITSHAEITGDFNAAYTVKSTAHADRAAGAPRDVTTTIDAKWLGPCAAGQRPGDIMMSNGMKMNVKDKKIDVKDIDINKLKALLPKQMPK